MYNVLSKTAHLIINHQRFLLALNRIHIHEALPVWLINSPSILLPPNAIAHVYFYVTARAHLYTLATIVTFPLFSNSKCMTINHLFVYNFLWLSLSQT